MNFILEIDDIVVWQERALDMIVDQGVLDYAVNLVLATRTPAAYGLDDLARPASAASAAQF